MYSMKCVWWAVLVLALGGRGLARAPRPVRPPDAETCVVDNEEHGIPYFAVNGIKFKYEFTNGELFAFKCPRGITLDEPRLPRFQPALQVREVRLTCPPPTASYEAVLSALNVTAPASRQDATQDPPTYSIKLELKDVRNFDAKVLAATPALRDLSIINTELTVHDLALLPIGLERIYLNNTNIGFVPADVLMRLPALSWVYVADNKPVMVEAAGNIRFLTIYSPSTQVSFKLPSWLEWLELFHWVMVRPEPWRACVGLDYLHLYSVAAETLPDGWLAQCRRIRNLLVLNAKNLRTLAAGALRGATALKVLSIRDCSLEALPAGLFDDARVLLELNLQGNSLRTIPSNLDLRDNYLDESVLDVLRAATSLNVLRLDRNPALDACPDTRDHEHTFMHGSSALGNLKNLTVLSLKSTATTRVCADWRQLPRLQEIDLRAADTRHITYHDLWFNNTVDTIIRLDSMNLSMRREDYDIIAAAPATPSVTLNLINLLRCDCELYWAAAVLRRTDTFLNEQDALCKDRRTLSNVPLDEFVCPAPGPCPDGCSCTMYEDIALPGRVLKLDCTGRNLRNFPLVDTRPESFVVDLRLAHNRIFRLRPKDLTGVVRLDLRNNSLRLIDNATASALVSRTDRRVLLANNPLECGCRAAAALATMRDHPDIFTDWDNATCANGTALSLAMPLPCDDDTMDRPGNVTKVVSDVSGMSEGTVAALVISAVAVAALAVLLGWPSLRHRLRVLPSQPPPPATNVGEWLYDAFVSFAHADRVIVHKLVERLEGGAEPFRLCVHYRDWMPGGWIPEQIAASVRVSRRTVAVVSEAYLRSKWARAEFREAYAAAVESAEPRLILVFLEDPTRLRLDPELSTYVAGNTYVCWGDPWFWQKLRRALPDPLPRQSNLSAAHASPGSSRSRATHAPSLLGSEIEMATIERTSE